MRIIATLMLFFSLFFVSGCGLFSLMPDSMQWYDGFDTGLRNDLWSFDVYNCVGTSCSSSNNLGGYVSILDDDELKLTGTYNGNTNTLNQGRAVSNKLFSSEDIKIKLFVKKGVCGTNPELLYPAKVFYGDFEIPLETSQGASCGPNQWWAEGENLIEIRRYDDLDLTKFVVIVNGEEVADGVNVEPEPLIFEGGLLEVDYVKWEPYFSCEVNYEYEVVVRDTFAGGSVISADPAQGTPLTYLPTKFCPQDLGVLICSEVGCTDEIGSLTETYAEGGVLEVPSDQYWQFDYVTAYVDSMEERCGVGEAYSTQLGACVSIATQQVSSQTLLYCEEDDDCIVPPQCYDATVECVDNQCDYESAVCTPEQIINYIEVIVTLEILAPQIVVVPEAVNEVSFVAPETVAGRVFSTSGVSVLTSEPGCQVEGGYLNPGNEGCYEVSASWGDYSFSIRNGEELQLDDQIVVYYQLQGGGVYNGEKNGVNYNYEFVDPEDEQNFFQIGFYDVFDLGLDSYLEKVVLGDPNQVFLEVDNKLFDLEDSGYRVKVSKGLVSEYLPTETVVVPFTEGLTAYAVDLPSDTLGTYVVEIWPYFEMLPGHDYVANERIEFGYYVSEDFIPCQQTGCVVGECMSDGTCVVGDGSLSYVSGGESDFGFEDMSWTVWGSAGIVLLFVLMLFVGVVLLFFRKR